MKRYRLLAVAVATSGCLGVACASLLGIEDPLAFDGNDGALGEDGATGDDSATDAGMDGSSCFGVDGGARSSQSCCGLDSTCGPEGRTSCCASSEVLGGTFDRSNDVGYPATISTFRLDTYEITLGRFRTFVKAGKGTQASPPAEGDGVHPRVPGSGWSSAFNASLAVDSDALDAALRCNPVYFSSWSEPPGTNDARPMNCITWFEAFAFCAWDGGWLPTEAEWNYAAAGGVEHREYPWGAGADPSKALSSCAGDAGCILPVGSKSPQGDGKWGHADLAGSMWEWSLDYLAEPYRIGPCNDCADLQPTTAGRVVRGGSFFTAPSAQLTSTRSKYIPTDRAGYVGARCARSR